MKTLPLATALALVIGIPAAHAQTAAPAPTIDKTQKVAQTGVYEIVHNPADKRVYVAATGPRGANAARIAVLDAATLQPVSEIDVSAVPLFGLGIDTRAQRLYGTATREGMVSAIDLKTGKITSFKPEGSTGAHLREVIVDEATGKAYASVMVGGERGEGPPQPQQVWVLDGNAGKVERVIPVDTKMLTGIAYDAAGGRIFVTGMGANEVVAIDAKTGAVKGRWPSGGEAPINLVYDAAGKRLFVANQKSGDMTVLDAATGAVKAKVPTGEGALGIAYDPTRQRVYVANRQAGTVTAIDARTNAVLANLATGTFPQTIAIDRASGAVYVTNKARGAPRNAPAGTPPVVDDRGDTVVRILP